jgi:TerC family integral membrane protein
MGEQWLWVTFVAVVLGMLTLDLAVFCRRPVAMSLPQALRWSLAWVSLAALFAVLVYTQKGSEKALEFVAGYVIEWSLSMDNLFVFLVIFTYFAIPEDYRHRVLFWGIMGAVILRGVFIATGSILLAWFEWVMYIFGAFLVFTGVKLLFQRDEHIEPARNPLLRLFRRFMAVTPEYHEQHFFVRLDRHWLATPLVPVFIVLATTDILFATDSIPAIFGITRDPFIVYASNVFAVLGLRGLFFVLSGLMRLFGYLKIGISLVLAFVGAKMLIVDFYRVSAGASLAVVVSILAVSIVASLVGQRRTEAVQRAAAETGGAREGQGRAEDGALPQPMPHPTIGGAPKATRAA